MHELVQQNHLDELSVLGKKPTDSLLLLATTLSYSKMSTLSRFNLSIIKYWWCLQLTRSYETETGFSKIKLPE